MSFETVSFARMRASLATAEDSSSATPIVAVRSNQLRGDLGSAPDLEGAFAWAEAVGFNGAAGSQCLVPNATRNGLAAVLMGVGGGSALDRVGALPTVLPTGVYRLAGPVFDELDQDAAALRWLLGAYRFERYRKDEREPARLVVADAETPLIIAAGVALTRDLVNTPTNDMGPSQLEQAARDLATAFSAETSLVVGDELIDQNFPMIHAVGRAGPQAPRLIDLRWGAEDAPKVTLVGKGVCFDTGGLDLKPAAGMRNMKKDMGGAATVLGLASMIMASNLRVRLRVLIPAVENSVASDAFRPGDVLTARNGVTVEIGNTDAEGRLVLADALVEACSEQPELLIDMATLTGAARVALGPDLPPFYANDETLAAEITTSSAEADDPVWRMPLWEGYRADLASKVAEINNITANGFAGSITAALFLERFISSDVAWAHFDVFAWNPKARPGRPEGGEHQAGRALFDLLRRRYGGR